MGILLHHNQYLPYYELNEYAVLKIRKMDIFVQCKGTVNNLWAEVEEIKRSSDFCLFNFDFLK